MDEFKKQKDIKFTTAKVYSLMSFSMDNGGYQVIRFLKIHSNTGYSSFIFNYAKNHILCNYLIL